MEKLLTSFTELTTGEGSRIAYTYSEIDEEGNIVSQNEKGNFVVTDKTLKSHILAIKDYISEHKLSE